MNGERQLAKFDAAPAPNEFDFWIEPGHTEKNYWKDLWLYRELFYFLAWRDTLVRYKQTAIGVVWAVIRPVLTMVVFTIIFGNVANLPTEGSAPYAILVFAAMLPWQFFANALADSSSSVVANAGLISKVYFPRLIIPASAIVVGLVDFAISFAILALIMLWYGFYPDWKIIVVPLFTALAVLAALGPGLFITALNVKYRDFRYVIPFVVQFGLFVSPVGFSSKIIREKFGETVFLIYSLNPMVGVIDGFRWALLGKDTRLYWPGFALSLVFTVFCLWGGLRYFRKTEKMFADVI